MKKLIVVVFTLLMIVGLGGEAVGARSLSLSQAALNESVYVFEREYPLANIEAVVVELDPENEVAQVSIRGYDALSSYELEIEYVEYGVRQQFFSDQLFKTAQREQARPARDDARKSLNMRRLISLDTASELATLENNNLGQPVRWTLFSDTREWWDIFNAAEESENPIWQVEMSFAPTLLDSSERFIRVTSRKQFSVTEVLDESYSDQLSDVRIDAMTGEILVDQILQ